MSVTVIGSIATKVYQADGYDFRMSFDGSVTSTLTYKVTSVGFNLNDFPALNSAHPENSQLTLFEMSASREAGQVMKVTLTYKGIGVKNPELYAQTEFNAATSSEPIETHPKFAFPFADPPVKAWELSAIKKALENNVDYGPNNKFIDNYGAAIGSTVQGRLLSILKKFGIESYLNLGGTYRRSFVQANIPTDYSNVGYIVKQPKGAPNIGIRTYLQTSLTWKKQASIISIAEEFTMSGMCGWNIHVYTKPENAFVPQALTDPDKLRAG